MEFFSGFSWAVPTAFGDAVALCRFEQGDTLYDTRKAYEEEWSDASKHIHHWLQVRYPAHAKTVAGESTGGIFEKNWHSEVKVDLYRDFKILGEGKIQTTQGRLYTALWTGNVAVLQLETEEPKIPLNVQDVNRKLKDTKIKASELSKGFPVFVMARDLSNKSSKAKYSKISSKLKSHLFSNPGLLNPKLAGIKDWKTVAPTVDIVFFPLINVSQEEVEALIKNAVYTPSKDAKKEMFKITAHGAIF